MSEIIKTFTGSGSINFEEDQREDLNSVNDAKSLSDQVVKLKNLEDELEEKEKELKELKRHIELVSGEVIPYHDARDEYLYIETSRWFFS